MCSEDIFNGSVLVPLKDKVKFFYVNPMMIDHEKVMEFINNVSDESIKTGESTGFLYKETIYKLKEKKN